MLGLLIPIILPLSLRLLNLGRNQGTPAHFGTYCIIQNSSSWKNDCIEAAIAGKMIVPKQWEAFCYSQGYSSPFSLELLVDSYSTFCLHTKGHSLSSRMHFLYTIGALLFAFRI